MAELTEAGKEAVANTALPFDEIRVLPQADGRVFVDLCHEGAPMWRLDSARVVGPGDNFSISGVRGELPVTLS